LLSSGREASTYLLINISYRRESYDYESSGRRQDITDMPLRPSCYQQQAVATTTSVLYIGKLQYGYHGMDHAFCFLQPGAVVEEVPMQSTVILFDKGQNILINSFISPHAITSFSWRDHYNSLFTCSLNSLSLTLYRVLDLTIPHDQPVQLPVIRAHGYRLISLP
jgi:hypothetical protein